MENNLQCKDLDERLINVLLHYVEERDMPLKIAKDILKHNLIERSLFEIYWQKFNTKLKFTRC
jgi:DNA-binding GntR family transcriptional regulator